MKDLKLILLVILLLLSSCGYHFEGGGYLNSDITLVAVEMIDNKSSETGVGVFFTNALIKEIVGKTDTKLVDDKTRADAVLQGKVNSITFDTLSRSTTEAVIDRRISASVDMQLVDNYGNVIWSVKSFITKDEYKVSEDEITDHSNRREALLRISTRTAERLVSKMTTNF